MRRLNLVLPCALLAVVTSCVDPDGLVAPAAPPPPIPNTPINALRLLEWAWDFRDYDALPGLFADDFIFVMADGDSAGNSYRDTWTREDELAASRNLFERAHDVQLDFDRNLVTLPDDRPGRNPIWHKTIRTAYALKVVAELDYPAQVLVANGFARFYLVRGDSAAIPPDQVERGVQPDSARWWIDRCEDETVTPGAAGHPARQMTWGAIKRLFR